MLSRAMVLSVWVARPGRRGWRGGERWDERPGGRALVVAAAATAAAVASKMAAAASSRWSGSGIVTVGGVGWKTGRTTTGALARRCS